MAKAQIIPDLFPVTLDGDKTWQKRGQYAKNIAETFALKLKADIKRAHVEEMMDALEKGQKEVSGEVPDELRKTFDRVQSDWDEAVAEVERKQEEEEEKKKEAIRAAEEKTKAEDKMLATVKGQTLSLGELAKKFDTGENMDRFVPRGKVSVEDTLIALNTGMQMNNFTNWMLGDLVKSLEDQGQLGIVSRLAEARGVNYSNIYNAAKTSRAVPPEKRTKGVSYTIFAEIGNARYSTDEKEHNEKLAKLVDKAASGEIKSSQEARVLKDKARGKKEAAPKLPEEDEKHTFIVVDHDNQKIEATLGFPRELFDSGATVINPKTTKMFTTWRNKPESRWTDLPIYKRAEEKKPETAAATNGKKGKKAKKK